MISEEKSKLIARCGRVFSPSAPVNKFNLFAGRPGQIKKVAQAVNTRGRHAIMYGDRGVGKTSLANILRELFADIHGLRVVKVNCVETDEFKNAWRKAMRQIPVIQESFEAASLQPLEASLEAHINDDGHFGPREVRSLLETVSQDDFELVVVFDEFDRLASDARDLFADLIKDLSDNSVNVTLILVGVARDVEQLIAGHASVDRCLMQIFLPPMNPHELRDILDKALATLGMTIDQDASELVISLSQGLPHYTHLLGQESAYAALNRDSARITREDVTVGIEQALENAQQTVMSDYHKAAQGQRKGTLFPQVLLACALAEADELGYFSSADVRTPLCAITKEDYDIPNFSQHLDKFSKDQSRGPVLEQWGKARRYRFRFRNPLLRPFIIMKGLRDGQISGDLILQMLGTVKSNESESKRDGDKLPFDK